MLKIKGSQGERGVSNLHSHVPEGMKSQTFCFLKKNSSLCLGERKKLLFKFIK
jgi:hypothetical protein